MGAAGAELQHGDAGEDLAIGHQHERELPDMSAGDLVLEGEARDGRCARVSDLDREREPCAHAQHPQERGESPGS